MSVVGGVLPALHYLPRSFNAAWSPGVHGDISSRPLYISVDGELVIFCLCGRVREVMLSGEDGEPVDEVTIEVAPLHHEDGSAVVKLVRQAGFHDRGACYIIAVEHLNLSDSL